MLYENCLVVQESLAYHQSTLLGEKMNTEVPIYYQVLYDKQAMEKCAHAFRNREGSNPSGSL